MTTMTMHYAFSRAAAERRAQHLSRDGFEVVVVRGDNGLYDVADADELAMFERVRGEQVEAGFYRGRRLH